MSSSIRNPVGRIWNNPATSAPGASLDPDHLSRIRDSHERSAALGLTRIDRPDHALLIRSDLAQARERNLRLHAHAAPVMEMLFEQIAGTESMIVLCDAHGTVLHSVGDDDFLQRADKVALAPGANWAEQSKGTNAIGTALFEERPTLVHADEHFMHANHFLTCSAAPIFDPRGNVLGVLDVTGDHRSYHHHTMGLVRMSARMIENHWLSDDCSDRLRLHFHSRVEFIGTLLEGILVVGADGRLVGANRSALDQLGVSGMGLRSHTLMTLLGTTPAAVIDHFRTPMPMPMQLALPDGRRFHFGARFHWTPRPGTGATLTGTEPAAAGTAQPPQPAAPRRAEPPAALGLAALCTGDARIEAAVDRVRRVLDRDVPLLVIGETGSGKQTLALAAHVDSRRASRPFVAVNCAAVPAASLEAELFGGGGRVALASGGTLFLGEVDAMPAGAQARLLQLIEDRRTDLALVCATQRDLRPRIEQRLFREDLYYRLNGLVLRLPPLRERSDLATLAARILARCCDGTPPAIAAEVMALFTAHAWPGNVRQLANVLRTAALLAGSEPEIGRAHLSEDFLDDAERPAPVAATPAAASTLEEAEIAMIRRVVDECGGNISEASKRLSISRNTIYRKLRWNQTK